MNSFSWIHLKYNGMKPCRLTNHFSNPPRSDLEEHLMGAHVAHAITMNNVMQCNSAIFCPEEKTAGMQQMEQVVV